ncbi:MAG TPA: hypothetical protein VKA67_11720, partial [Verrucomicrobiae bacterium]|nr:hypothetical protein [Verrucomicrobiae bacterium]
NGDRPKLLESLVETVRGERLSKIRCRRIADARAETLRHWQSCDLSKERARLPGGANPEIPGTAQEPKKVSS